MTRLRVASLLSFLLFALAVHAPNIAAADLNADAAARYAALPLAFEENRGQAHARARYLARGSGYTLFLSADEAVLRLGATRGTVLRTRLLGAQAARIAAEAELPGKANYLTSRDAREWVTDVRLFERVRYAGVYPGIDLVYYGRQGRLEYDFELAPGADPSRIRLHIAGAGKLQLEHGDLVLESGGMKVRWAAPVAYQQAGGERKLVPARYVLRGDEIAFALGDYDRSRPLVIDPALVYATYLGGSRDADPFNSEDSTNPPGSASQRAADIAVDSSGNAYVFGITSAVDFPVTAGAYDTTENGSSCSPHGGSCTSMFVTKLNAGGSALVYSTYFGRGLPAGIAVDGGGRAYLTGNVAHDGGGVPTTANAYSHGEGCDFDCRSVAFLTILTSAGNGLVYSTHFDPTGEWVDPGGIVSRDVAVGAQGVAYITGYTTGGLPVTSNAYQSHHAGGKDGFIAKFNPAGDTGEGGTASLVFSTYIGGTGDDDATALATEGGRVYITGATASTDFPTTAAAFDRTYNGGPADAFIAKLDTNQQGGAALVFSTLVGGAAHDAGLAIALNGTVPHVLGSTMSSSFPTTSGAHDRTYAGGSCGGSPCPDVFVLKLAATGSSLLYSTYLGGSGMDGRGEPELGAGIAVDGAGNAVVTGVTTSSDYPTTADAFDRTRNTGCANDYFSPGMGCADVFLTRFSPAGALLYSTYFGGSDNDDHANVAVDGAGNAYISGRTRSSDFPVTSSAYQRTRIGAMDAFVAKFSFAAASACTASGGDRTVTICSPQNGQAYGSPVLIEAAADPGSSSIQVMQVYVDGQKQHEQTNTTSIRVELPMSPGEHRVTVQALDSSGAFKSTVFITVSSDGGGSGTCSATGSDRTVTICEPANGATVASPVRIRAAANPGSSAVTRMNVWVDGVKQYEQLNTTSIDTSLSMAAGTHRVTVQAADSAGTFKSTVFITVSGSSGPECPPPGPVTRAVTICTPRDGQTYSSPVLVHASASPGSSPIKVMQLYVDGVKRYETPGAELKTTIALSSGEHRVTVQALDSEGAFKSTIFILIQ